MSVTSDAGMQPDRAEPARAAAPKSPPIEVYCPSCAGWLGTVPAGTRWLRTRCINRRCAKYGQAQQIATR